MDNGKIQSVICSALIICLILHVIIMGSGFSLVYSQENYNSIHTAQELVFFEQLDSFYQQLEKLSENQTDHIFMAYSPVIARQLNIKQLYTPRYAALERLLDAAVDASIDVLTLFTQAPVLDKNNKILVFDKQTLLRLNRQFDLHGLFLISTESAKGDSLIQMNFLVAGQGKFVVGYDDNKTIIHPDYNFATGRYDYCKLFLMEIKIDENGETGMFDMRGISSPDGVFKPMKGPMNVSLNSLSLIPKKGHDKNILIRYKLFGVNKKIIPCIPIEKRVINN